MSASPDVAYASLDANPVEDVEAPTTPVVQASIVMPVQTPATPPRARGCEWNTALKALWLRSDQALYAYATMAFVLANAHFAGGFFRLADSVVAARILRLFHCFFMLLVMSHVTQSMLSMGISCVDGTDYKFFTTKNTQKILKFAVVLTVYGLLSFLGLMLFVVPGIIFMAVFNFAPLIALEKPNVGICKSFYLSAKITRSKRCRISCIYFAVMAIVAALFLALAIFSGYTMMSLYRAQVGPALVPTPDLANFRNTTHNLYAQEFVEWWGEKPEWFSDLLQHLNNAVFFSTTMYLLMLLKLFSIAVYAYMACLHVALFREAEARTFPNDTTVPVPSVLNTVSQSVPVSGVPVMYVVPAQVHEKAQV